MTNEEAIETIKTAIAEVEWYYPLNYAVAFEVAISALEKQIPKKPIINKRKIQCVNGHNQPTQHYKYCPMCGQMIDWSDT